MNYIELSNQWVAAMEARDAAWDEYIAALEKHGFTTEVWELCAKSHTLKGRAEVLSELCANERRAAPESVTPVPAPTYPHQHATWGMMKRRCIPDPLKEYLQLITDAQFEIVPERAVSWREQIVDDEVKKDGAA